MVGEGCVRGDDGWLGGVLEVVMVGERGVLEVVMVGDGGGGGVRGGDGW